VANTLAYFLTFDITSGLGAQYSGRLL
jgi:hypothetical protein